MDTVKKDSVPPEYSLYQEPAPPYAPPPYVLPPPSSSSYPAPPPAAVRDDVHRSPYLYATHIANPPEPPEPGCFESNQKNKPQSNSIGAASLIFSSGGMAIAWSFGFSGPLGIAITLHMKISWFIAAIIGVTCSAIATNRLEKKSMMITSSFLIVLSGVLFMAWPNRFDAIMTSRYLNGFACGFIFVTTLVMAGEESVKSKRGMNASSIESMSFNLGIYLQLIYGSLGIDSDSAFNTTQMNGALSVIFGGVAVLIAMFLVIESPVYLLLNNQEEQAIDALRRLQRPATITYETYQQLEEHKRYIADNRTLSLLQSAKQGFLPLVKLCIYRSLMALSFSYMFTAALIDATDAPYGVDSFWTYYVCGILRWLAITITIFTMDSIGRKKPMLFGVFISSIMALAVGIIMIDIGTTEQFAAVVVLLLVFSFTAGISLSSSSSYLTEAFPLAIKPYYIAIVFTVEMLVQIIICASDINSEAIASYFITVGILYMLYFIFGYFCMPETKRTTLREAQHKFQPFVSREFRLRA